MLQIKKSTWRKRDEGCCAALNSYLRVLFTISRFTKPVNCCFSFSLFHSCVEYYNICKYHNYLKKFDYWLRFIQIYLFFFFWSTSSSYVKQIRFSFFCLGAFPYKIKLSCVRRNTTKTKSFFFFYSFFFRFFKIYKKKQRMPSEDKKRVCYFYDGKKVTKNRHTA